SFCFSLLLPPPPRSTLFPYTTLFRSLYHQITGMHGESSPSFLKLVIGSRYTEGEEKIAILIGGIYLGVILSLIFVLIVSGALALDRKSTRLNSSHLVISYAVFCLKKK